jgi:hypothetical protein
VEVAVIVTVAFEVGQGMLFGAIYVTLAPLALWLGVKVPQFVLGQPDAVQSTPPGAISLVTVAVNVAGTPAVIGCVCRLTVIG